MTPHPCHNISKIRLHTALLSLVLSVLSFYLDDIINRDGIKYVNMAEIFLSSGFNDAAQIMGWPFFSILIAYIHKITTLPFEYSAYLINSFLFVLVTDSFILLSNRILQNKQHLIYSSLFILCFYSLNEYRDFIIRDVGYWAFCSLSLLHFIHFLESPSWKNALFWQLLTIVSILFRIEGIIILLALPLYLFSYRSLKLAFYQASQLYFLLLTSLLLIGLFSLGLADVSSLIERLASERHYSGLLHLFDVFNHKVNIISSQVLNKHSQEYAALILGSGLLVMLIYKLIKGVTIAYLGLYFISRWQQKNTFQFPYQYLLTYFLFLNILILVAFLFHGYFMSTRYMILTLLTALLLMLPRLCDFIESLWLTRNKRMLTLVGLILFIGLVDSVTSSRSKSYIKATAIWAGQNLPENVSILTDNTFIRYYFNSQKPTSNLYLENNINTYKKYNYLIVVEKRHNKELKEMLQQMDIQSQYSLENKRGDKTTIYKVLP